MNKLQTKINLKEFNKLERISAFLSLFKLFFSRFLSLAYAFLSLFKPVFLAFFLALECGIWSYTILLFKQKLHKPLLKHAREANFLQSLLATVSMWTLHSCNACDPYTTAQLACKWFNSILHDSALAACMIQP